MSLRSLLFVPGDSEKKLAKSLGLAADVLILDLEDAVAPAQKPAARVRVTEFLAAHPVRTPTQLWVRINPLDTAEALADLTAVMAARPDGIIQPKTRSPDDVVQLAHYLDVLESQHGIASGSTRILPVATETAEAIFTMGGFARCGVRLAALTWGAEDLGTVLGVSANKEADGRWTQPFQLARTLCLFGASAASVPAIDTLYTDFRDPVGLRAACAEASRDGFSGKIAIHPDQVATINECFMPSATEIAHASQIVEMFRANPGVAALSLDGKMIDIPHLHQAEKILARVPK
jgi:citrate lyase subunit beta / citryl-CoA lyase